MQNLTKPLEESRQGEAVSMPAAGFSRTGKKFYIESYGCQMNFNDSEIVASLLVKDGFESTTDFDNADLILINTCAIRENAEQRVRGRLNDFTKAKKEQNALIGVMGCMAERLKEKFLEEEKLVDIVVGPDAYRDLPNLVKEAESGQKAVNVLLSREETYADVNPVRLGSNGVSAFISITRGCDNMCAFCVVPFTRGRERSRNPESIVAEAQDLFNKGYREVTLLGQNVDSYLWLGKNGLKKDLLKERNETPPPTPPRGGGEMPKAEGASTVNFAQLLEMVAQVNPELRVRFSTSHPKDMTDEVLYTMAKYENICNYIHLPVQSGNSRVLELMNRGYTREWYMERIRKIREIIPDCGISTDIITGFCTETEEEHRETLSIVEWVKYDLAYMFTYSERPGTQAARKLKDDVSEAVKKRRLSEVIELQRKCSFERNKQDVGKTFKVLVEGASKKDAGQLKGRNDQNKMIVFPNNGAKPGDYVSVLVEKCTSATLIGKAV